MVYPAVLANAAAEAARMNRNERARVLGITTPFVGGRPSSQLRRTMYADAWEPMDAMRDTARERLRVIEAMIQAELLRT
jgi:hypothetical protein